MLPLVLDHNQHLVDCLSTLPLEAQICWLNNSKISVGYDLLSVLYSGAHSDNYGLLACSYQVLPSVSASLEPVLSMDVNYPSVVTASFTTIPDLQRWPR